MPKTAFHGGLGTYIALNLMIWQFRFAAGRSQATSGVSIATITQMQPRRGATSKNDAIASPLAIKTTGHGNESVTPPKGIDQSAALWSLDTFARASPTDSRAAINVAIRQGIQNIESVRIDGSHWDLMPYLGTHYISQYALMLRWLGRTKTDLDENRLKQELITSQLKDGSWQTVSDPNAASGDLNATIFNYWALKSMGISEVDPRLKRAWSFVINQGGIEKSSVFTKIFLALAGQYDWDNIPSIPALLFEPWSPVKPSDFGQWIGPHLLPMSYLSRREIARSPPTLANVRELYVDSDRSPPLELHMTVAQSAPISSTDESLIEQMIAAQQPRGSLGGYTLATLLAQLAVDDYLRSKPEKRTALEPYIERSFDFIEDLSFRSGDESAYKGVTCNGKLWDTALMGIALNEAGVDERAMKPVADFLAKQ